MEYTLKKVEHHADNHVLGTVECIEGGKMYPHIILLIHSSSLIRIGRFLGKKITMPDMQALMFAT